MLAFTALADPTRRRILELLAQGERPMGDIAASFDVSAPAISQHLKVLREAGLVAVRVDAQKRVYRLEPKGFEEVDAWLRRIGQFREGFLDPR